MDDLFDDDFIDEIDADEEDEREQLMDLGLDPDDPDYSELAPHGFGEDDDEDDWADEDEEDDECD